MRSLVPAISGTCYRAIRTIYQVEALDMAEIELATGTVEYEDTGGDGPVLVFQHGVAMAGSEWREVVADLRSEHRCIVPELPLGAHRRPVREDADLSFPGLVRLLTEFLERLDLRDVTLVGSDFGL